MRSPISYQTSFLCTVLSQNEKHFSHFFTFLLCLLILLEDLYLSLHSLDGPVFMALPFVTGQDRISFCVCNLQCSIIQADCMFVGNFVIINIWKAAYMGMLLVLNYMVIYRCCFVFNRVLDCLCLFFFFFVLSTDLSKRDMLFLGSMKSEWLELAFWLGSVCMKEEARRKRERGSVAGGSCCFCWSLVLILKMFKYEGYATK